MGTKYALYIGKRLRMWKFVTNFIWMWDVWDELGTNLLFQDELELIFLKKPNINESMKARLGGNEWQANQVRQNLKKSIRTRIGGNQPFQGQNLKKSIRA